MKVASQKMLSTILLVTAGLALASAQAFPACAGNCSEIVASSSTCPAFDSHCYCSTQSFLNEVSCCIQEACNSSEVVTAISVGEVYCAQANVTNVFFPACSVVNGTTSVQSATKSTATAAGGAGSTSPASSGSGNPGLSAGAIAGIVIGSVLGVLILLVLGFCFLRRSKRRNAAPVPPEAEPLPETSPAPVWQNNYHHNTNKGRAYELGGEEVYESPTRREGDSLYGRSELAMNHRG